MHLGCAHCNDTYRDVFFGRGCGIGIRPFFVQEELYRICIGIPWKAFIRSRYHKILEDDSPVSISYQPPNNPCLINISQYHDTTRRTMTLLSETYLIVFPKLLVQFPVSKNTLEDFA